MSRMVSDGLAQGRDRAGLREAIDRRLESIPSVVVQVVLFVSAFAVIFSRRPDAVLHPQFFAEDGMWYADAYNIGGIRPLLTPFAGSGYLHTLNRITALLAQFVPLARGPLLFNLVAIAVQILPVQFLASSRCAWLGSISNRLLLGFLYLALPNTAQINANLTNAQWHLELLAFLVIIAAPAVTLGWRCFNVLVALMCSLTGPFGLLLAPVCALLWWKNRSRHALRLLVMFAAGALVQGLMILRAAPAHRLHGRLGATPELLAKILADQVFLGTLVGANSLCHTNSACAFLVALAGISIFAYAWSKGPVELKLFIALAGLALAAPLLFPPGSELPAWQFLEQPGATGRYWFIPMLAFAATLVWMLNAATARALRSAAMIALLLMSFGIVRQWRYPAFVDLSFAEYSKKFEAAPKGTLFTIPLNPPGWSMQLVKH